MTQCSRPQQNQLIAFVKLYLLTQRGSGTGSSPWGHATAGAGDRHPNGAGASREDDSQWLQNHCMKMGDAYIIVYSVTDKVSFEKASELRIQLRRARQTEDIPIILVGNKSDLVRSREVSVDEGRACAVVFDCKFIETSAALHHNVKDLFEGIVRQIRLRKDSKEDNARRMANTKRRESIGKKAKRFLGRIVAKNNKKMAFKAKSKSCHDLSVL
nr:PREDICTED: GTP-binding protein RAD [Opisthocomus hoazin]